MTEDRMTSNPRVFVSYASEDKERFVLRFAQRLLSEGIQPWVYEWEMFPGDKLIDKIFNQGLKKSDVVIVVLSTFSIRKPWVQKELDIAVVKNIEDNTRLIPVRLDGCDVPECLRNMSYQGIKDLDNYDQEFDRIVKIIHGQFDKPTPGTLPPYTDPDLLQMHGLCRNDSLFLAEACRIAIQQGHPFINPEPLVMTLKEMGMSERDMMDSQEVLAGHYYIKTSPTAGPPYVYHFTITTYGMRLFAEAGGVPDYAKNISDVARILVEGVLVNNTPVTNGCLESELNLPAMLVEHILEVLRDSGQIKYDTEIGGRLFMHVYWVSPELRRKMEGNG